MQITLQRLAGIARDLRTEGADNPEYDRALAEMLRDALAAAGGEYAPDGPSLDDMLARVSQADAPLPGKSGSR